MSALEPTLPMADDTALLDTIDNLFLEFENIALQFTNLTDMDSLGKSTDQIASPIPLEILEIHFDMEFELFTAGIGISSPPKHATFFFDCFFFVLPLPYH